MFWFNIFITQAKKKQAAQADQGARAASVEKTGSNTHAHKETDKPSKQVKGSTDDGR